MRLHRDTHAELKSDASRSRAPTTRRHRRHRGQAPVLIPVVVAVILLVVLLLIARLGGA